MPTKLIWSHQARTDLMDIYVLIGLEQPAAAERYFDRTDLGRGQCSDYHDRRTSNFYDKAHSCCSSPRRHAGQQSHYTARLRRRSIHSPSWPWSALSIGQPGAVSIKCRRIHASPKQSSGPNNCTNAQASSSVTGALTFESCSSNVCTVETVAVAELGSDSSLRSALIASCIFIPQGENNGGTRCCAHPRCHSGWCASTRPGISRFPDAQLRI